MVADIYLDLREVILRGDPHAHSWAPTPELPNVWGALVEVGLPEGPATLVSLVDGTTSLYLGNGGATIGAGEAAPVAEATRRLLATVETALSHLTSVWEFPLPTSGRVRVVALTFSGPMGADAAEADLVAGRGPLALIYAASADVLAEIGRLDAAMPQATEPAAPETSDPPAT
jgi:hypothetical protein